MTKDVCLSWASHGNVLSDSLWKLFKESYRTDLDLSLSGHYLKVHHLILAIFCPLIKDIEDNKFIKGENLLMEKDDLKFLVEFMYRGKINVPRNRLPHLLQGAETLGFQALAGVIKKYLAVKNKRTKGKKRKLDFSEANFESAIAKSDEEVTPKINVEGLESVGNSDGMEFDFDTSRTSYRRSVDYSSFDPTSLQHVCKHCQQGFDVFDDYVNHVRQHENPELTHKCRYCNYITSKKIALTQHCVARHQVDINGKKLEKNLKCSQCSYTCYAKFQLQNHLYTSHSEKPLKCESCNFATTSKACLTKHVRIVHLNERPFMCETCGNRFKTFQAFRNHLISHSGKKRMCSICGASLTITSFQSHMKTHSEERPFPCSLCSFAARKRYNLKVHLKNVHKISVEEMGINTNQELIIGEEEVQNHDTLSEAIMTINEDFEYEIVPNTSELTVSET